MNIESVNGRILHLIEATLVLTYINPSRFSKKTLVYSLAGLALGTIAALLYRYFSNVGLLPQTLTFVALIAPLIGITEELLFRGFLQVFDIMVYGGLSSWPVWVWS